jgi:hypothetical protein
MNQLVHDSMSQSNMSSLDKAAELKQRTQGFCDPDRQPLSFAAPVSRRTDSRKAGSAVRHFCCRELPGRLSVCRARSKAEFIAKMGIVVEEADETVFWLELLSETGIVSAQRTQQLMKETNQLVAIFGASLRTSKGSGSE